MAVASFPESQLKCLIDAYARQIIHASIPIEITNMISIHYGLSGAFVRITPNTRSSKIIELLDIYSTKSYSTNIYFTSPSPIFTINKKQLVVPNACLPLSIKHKCKTKYAEK